MPATIGLSARVQHMQVIGLCRFSYPALGGFQVAHETVEDRMRYLYQPARMEERLRLFETVALPGLKKQTDGDFTFVIVTGTSLPAPYAARLQALVADMPQARIVSAEPGKMRDVMKQVFRDARHGPRKPVLQFRHDDDDAVSVDFVERLRQAAEGARGLLASSGSVAIDYSLGYTASFGPEGITAAETYRPWLGVGLAMYAGPGVGRSIMNFAHNKMPRHMPALAFSDAPMWVRGHNRYNDSRQGKTCTDPELLPLSRDQEREFAMRFAIDADQVRARFAPAAEAPSR